MHALENERRLYVLQCHCARLAGQPLPPLPDVLREAGDQPQADNRLTLELPPNGVPRGTSTDEQRSRLLEALRSGPKTSVQLRRLGLFKAPTRIFELRAQGYEITTERISLFDAHGYPHARVARYMLTPSNRAAA